MIKKTFNIFISMLLFINFIVGQNGMGLIFDPIAYDELSVFGSGFNFTEKQLGSSSNSLKSYCYTPKNQGSDGSCVGFACSAALSASYAINSKSTETNVKSQNAFSALYIYNQIKVADCANGSRIEDALKLLNSKGDCKFDSFNPNTCTAEPSIENHTEAGNYKIKSFESLFGRSVGSDNPAKRKENIINSTIRALSAKKPIVIGMNVTKSLKELGKNTLWQPYENEFDVVGGHALCVIGYDINSKQFEIINSWGTGWGDNGFFKVSFDDYAKFVKYGYTFSVDAKQPNEPVILTADFKFKKFGGQDSNGKFIFNNVYSTKSSDAAYQLTNDEISKGDYFRLEARNMKKNSFVYLISLKPNNEIELIYPNEKWIKIHGATEVKITTSEIVPDDDVFLTIPENEENAITADYSGTDFLCVMVSSEKINNIQSTLQIIKNSNAVSFYDKLKEAFGTKLIPLEELSYDTNNMSVSANSKTGSIAPIILKVNVQ